jgi:hypothetical protein
VTQTSSDIALNAQPNLENNGVLVEGELIERKEAARQYGARRAVVLGRGCVAGL